MYSIVYYFCVYCCARTALLIYKQQWVTSTLTPAYSRPTRGLDFSRYSSLSP